MPSLRAAPVAVLSLLALPGCGGGLTSHVGGSQDTSFVDTTDSTPPVIEHTPIEDAQQLGADVPVTATVTDDDSGMFQVTLYYKNETSGSGDWESQLMTASDGGLYSGLIPGDMESSGGMNYYIKALDNAQNESDSPERGAEDPWHFRLYE